jgi:hypothetical protein
VSTYCSWTGIHYSGMAVIDCIEKAVKWQNLCPRHLAEQEQETEEHQAYEAKLRAEGYRQGLCWVANNLKAHGFGEIQKEDAFAIAAAIRDELSKLK